MDVLIAFYFGLIVGATAGFFLATAIAISRGNPCIDRDAADLQH